METITQFGLFNTALPLLLYHEIIKTKIQCGFLQQYFYFIKFGFEWSKLSAITTLLKLSQTFCTLKLHFHNQIGTFVIVSPSLGLNWKH